MTSTTRLRPHRMGIVGLYEYADQVFCAEEGRLALRGRNTSGKSKALELLIPFVLDGDITPRKLDPFASSAKTMRWNLIECTDPYAERRSNKRVGYVWAEFRAVDEAGVERWLTCGIGLEATRHTDGVKERWYFTTDQRIGADLHLVKPAGDDGHSQPIGKREFVEQLRAGGGELLDGPSAYKDALRRRLLPFATPELYDQMLEVVRQLRKPKLSESLNISRLSEMLTNALPAVDEQLVRRLGDALEQLHELQRQYDDLAAARTLVASIAEREYRSYARGVVGVRADALRQSDGAVERARSRARSAAEALAGALEGLAISERETERLEGRRTRVDAEYDQLVRSDAFEVVALIDDRTRERDEAVRRVTRSDEMVEEAAARASAAAAAAASEAEVHVGAAARVRTAGAELDAALAAAGMASVAPEPAALDALPARLAVRGDDVERGLDLMVQLVAEQQALDALAAPVAAADADRDRVAATLSEVEAQLEQALEAFAEELDRWRTGLTELELRAPDAAALYEMAVAGESLAGRVSVLAAPRAAELERRAARVDAALHATRTDRDALVTRIAELEATTDPLPDARPGRGDRTGRPGAPLWAACDFRPELLAADRASLEAALEHAGLLDAWISPDGTIHEDDLSLVATPVPGDGVPTLSTLLTADRTAGAVSRAAVEAVLESVALDGVVSVGPGRFRFGPLHGRASKPAAQFIGAAARAAHRQRLLDERRAELAGVEERLARQCADADQLCAARQQLDAECGAVPSTEALRSAQRADRVLRERLSVAEQHLAALLEDRDRREARVVGARDAATAHARTRDLPTAIDDLRSAARAVDRAYVLRDGVIAAAAGARDAATRAQRALDGQESAHETLKLRHADRAATGAELAAAEGRLGAALSADGATAVQLRDRATTLRRERDDVDEALREGRARHGSLVGAAADAKHAAHGAVGAVEAAEQGRVAALEGVRELGANDLLSAALGADAPADEREAPSWTLTTALERMRALPQLEVDVSLDNRARRVGGAVSELQRKLVAFDMDVATVPAGGLTLLEIERDGRRVTPPAMLAELGADLEHREQILSAKRREVLSRALLGEIAEHLRTKIVGVRASVRARNETLRRCPTGAGRTVSLAWEVDEDLGVPRDVLELLADRSVAHLPKSARETLFGFLEARIATAREGADDAGDRVAIVDHLAAALDYRRWWRFELYLHERDGGRRRLTARTQGLGSGGEQSVLMHLPLFATAAALYDLAPGAPRIVALDEAMDGIDPLTREQMFAVLVELDLDWVMTSYDLNPCVATVPRVGFYELHRDNAEWGVFAQHFVWDGERATEVVDG
ncbi:MAG: hypothetical protein QOD83_2498 [Solirubrobacteraceae bacterium]|jgi:uncharacterized protein (TIGR02680 family)|nr:hypothetical protein [Solirubrobacteraceae bacterium]